MGLRPKYVDAPGAREYCLTSDDLFSLPYNPGKTLCIGASYVSLECAGFLHGVGCEVVVMVRSILLRGFDQDIAEKIRAHMIERGVRFLSGIPARFERVREPNPKEKDPGAVKVSWRGKIKVPGKDGKEEEIEGEFEEEFNTVLIAVGREAKTEDLGE